jgi:hypothetical protein
LVVNRFFGQRPAKLRFLQEQNYEKKQNFLLPDGVRLRLFRGV